MLYQTLLKLVDFFIRVIEKLEGAEGILETHFRSICRPQAMAKSLQ